MGEYFFTCCLLVLFFSFFVSSLLFCFLCLVFCFVVFAFVFLNLRLFKWARAHSKYALACQITRAHQASMYLICISSITPLGIRALIKIPHTSQQYELA